VECPDAGVAIRLQFHLHPQRVRIGFGRLLLRGANLLEMPVIVCT
jgi:hypothetical protein